MLIMNDVIMSEIDTIIGEDPGIIIQKAFADFKRTTCYESPLKIITYLFKPNKEVRLKLKKESGDKFSSNIRG